VTDRLQPILATIQGGDYAAADAALAALIADSGSSPEERRHARGTRAFMNLGIGRLDEATADLQVLSEETPDDLAIRYHLLEALMKSRRAPEALETLRDLIRLDPANPRLAGLLWSVQSLLGPTPLATGRAFPEPIPSGPFNPLLRDLEKDAASSFPTSIYPEVARFIYSLVRAVRPQLVVETGSYIGYSSTAIAQALNDGDCGHLHCFDLFGPMSLNAEGKPRYVSPVLGPKDSFLDIAQGHLARAGLAHRATLHAGDSSSTMLEVLKGLKQKVDFAFIDGDHTIPGCLIDWYAVDEFTREGAIIVLHDTNPQNCKWMGPRYLLDKLSEKQRAGYQWVNIPTHETIGLAVIQKLGDGKSGRFAPTLLELAKDYFFTRRYWPFWTGSRSVRRSRE
jgi:predicted O-methyltransferase YrrM